MRIAITILIAAVLGVVWVMATTRARTQPRAPRRTGRPGGSARSRRRRATPVAPTVESVLRAYQAQHYDDVITDAPVLLASIPDGGDDDHWRTRVHLVLGHSYFDAGDYPSAIEHLTAGLDSPADNDTTGRARFEHCLGFAYQQTGQPDQARVIYARLLDDEDLDPVVREGVARHLAQIDDAS